VVRNLLLFIVLVDFDLVVGLGHLAYHFASKALAFLGAFGFLERPLLDTLLFGLRT